ncbi:MAG TPA: condensation domain-containing protein, partial [Thermoanaerobaculia bacterium]
SPGTVVARERADEPSIGRSLPGTRSYVVDRGLAAQPLGVPGELCLAGAGLARGYLGRPELTAEKFVPCPFASASSGSGERMYRTGDLVRYRTDGEIEFLGRIDHQVKVRGYRIELGEIEAALLACPGVREAVVVVREEASGDRRLVAYCGGAEGEENADLIRGHLAARLPAPMLPSAIVLLPALPLTKNGKIDRKALPAPAAAAAASDPGAVPLGPIEELLAGLWCELLGLPAVGTHDSFFQLGGHSLLATLLLSRVRDAFGVELPLAAVFAAPTVASLARRIETARGAEHAAPQPIERRQTELAKYAAARGEASGPAQRSALARELLLPELPLTAQGEVDLDALPRLAAAAEGTPSERAPRTPIERTIAALWTELLDGRPVLRDESFFELGGHSLLATRLLWHLRDTLGVDLPLTAVFETKTIAALAARIVQTLAAGGGRAARIESTARDAGLPVSFGQERLWLLDRLQPGLAVYNLPLALRLEGALDLPALSGALSEIVRRHEALRTVFAEAAGVPLQIVEPHRPSALGLPLVVDLAALPGAAVEREGERLLLAAAERPFDLATGPLFSALLFRHGECAATLLLAMHHIVSDGWSLGVVLSELRALYAAFRERQPSPRPAGSAGHSGSAGLAELPLQYPDYAAWQRQFLSGEVLAAQLAYWREALAGAPTVLELPTDRPRPAQQSFRGARLEWTVPAERTAALTALGQGRGATLFMVLLSAFSSLLARYTGRDDLLLGTAVANRGRSELEGLIGFFVNTLVL